MYAGIIPLLILSFSADTYYKIQYDSNLLSYRAKLENNLEPLLNYHDDRVYFHAILQKHFRLANSSNKPLENLAQLENH